MHFIANWFFNSLCLFACTQWRTGMHLIPDPHIPLYLVVMELGLVLTIMNTTLRPILLMLLIPLNGLTVGLLSVFLNGIFFVVLDRFAPSFEMANFWVGLLATFIFAVLNMILQTFIPIDDDIIYFSILGQRRAAKNKESAQTKGLVMLEIDGLSYPRLMQAVEKGQMPFLKDLLQSGIFVSTPYDCGIPSQTSSCQAGIMYGRNQNICAYRWYDKANHRVYSSGSTRDAADMERMLFNGDKPAGILDNGMSINNIISGNASENIFTISKLLPGSREEIIRVNRDMFFFALRPYLLPKSLLLTFLDAGREILSYCWDYISRKKPRLNRLKGFYPLVRGAANILLRDLSTALIADAVAEGKESVYTTFLGYDEIAHHSGPDSHEAYNALSGIDRSVRKICESIQLTNARSYDLVILSDHGQSYGATFKQRYGESLGDYIRSIALRASRSEKSVRVVSVEDDDDNSANVVAVLNVLGGEDKNSLVGQTAGNLENAIGSEEKTAIAVAENEANDIIVLASGNLANAYFQDKEERLDCDDIEEIYPGLITQLAAHPGVGIVCVHTKEGPLVFGEGGTRNLESGIVEGTDPLVMYDKPDLRARQLNYLMSFPNSGDLVIISPVYEDGTVAAYEELIGSHGGLGGQQTTPFLMYPAAVQKPGIIENSCDVFGFLQQVKNAPLPAAEEKTGAEETVSFKSLLRQIIHIKSWIFDLAKTMFFSPAAYRNIAENPAFDGPALLIGFLTLMSSWTVLNLYSGADTREKLINLVVLLLVYGIEITASYLTIIILRGKRKPWNLIRTILFTGYFEFLWLILLTHRAVSVWVTVILLLRITTLTSSVINAGNLKRRFSLPVFLMLVILIPVLFLAVILIYNFIVFVSTGEVNRVGEDLQIDQVLEVID